MNKLYLTLGDTKYNPITTTELLERIDRQAAECQKIKFEQESKLVTHDDRLIIERLIELATQPNLQLSYDAWAWQTRPLKMLLNQMPNIKLLKLFDCITYTAQEAERCYKLHRGLCRAINSSSIEKLVDQNGFLHHEDIAYLLESNRRIQELKLSTIDDISKLASSLIQNRTLKRLKLCFRIDDPNNHLDLFIKAINQSQIRHLKLVINISSRVTLNDLILTIESLIPCLSINKLILNFHNWRFAENIALLFSSFIVDQLNLNRCLKSFHVCLDKIYISKVLETQIQEILVRNRTGWLPNNHHVYASDWQKSIEQMFMFLQRTLPNELCFIILSLV